MIVAVIRSYPPLLASGYVAYYGLHGLPLAEPWLVATVACVEHHIAQGIEWVVIHLKEGFVHEHGN